MKSNALSSDVSAWKWWESNRRRYNVWLAIAGLVACAIFTSVHYAFRSYFHSHLSIFDTIVQGIAYLLFMGLANVCYFLGHLSERLVRPTEVAGYRRLVFSLGLWISCSVPFVLPSMDIIRFVWRGEPS
jgi:hypothetical protein